MFKQFVALPILSLALVTIAPAANAISLEFTSVLNGAQEVGPVVTPATGTAFGTLTGDPGSYVFTYTVNYSGLQGAIASPFAHLHNAPSGSNGPIVHDLDGANLPPIAGSLAGTIAGDWRFDDPSKPLTNALAQELINGNIYFNLHTSFSTRGEIRGQIAVIPTPPALLGAAIFGGMSLLRKRRESAS